ncbi:MAG TPA: methylated-DNA--[protein]-cysteine S-methyltransferase [Thermoanaerobaculia bacterium]|nr:methylated-DNA--[protein]-cysteine S-methyltransferase [Thermoanaerobaculia bacterium]
MTKEKDSKMTISESLEVGRALRSIPLERAPRSLLPAVLSRIGLADGYWEIDSPVGRIFVAHSKAGISLVSRARSAADFEKTFRARYGRPIGPSTDAPPANVKSLVAGRVRGRDANVRFDLRGVSEFERAVLLKALEIPPGEVRPYSWIAREIGHPDAVRAAGSALAKNPVPLLIPCHRVVRSDGHIGNYSLGGPRNKRTLLAAEGADPRMLEKLAAAGVRYLGNEQGRFYCFPTCGGLESLIRDNQVRFGSSREAQAAGFRPCAECRPAAVA